VLFSILQCIATEERYFVPKQENIASRPAAIMLIRVAIRWYSNLTDLNISTTPQETGKLYHGLRHLNGLNLINTTLS